MDDNNVHERTSAVRDNDGLADDGTRRSDAGQLLVDNATARQVHREQFSHKRWGWYLHRLKLGLVLVYDEDATHEMSTMHQEAVHVAAQYKFAWEKQIK